MQGIVRNVLTWILVGVVLSIILAVVGEWFISVAKDKGLYDDAGEKWDRAIASVARFVQEGSVLYPVTALSGIVAGLWVDVLLSKLKERSQTIFDTKSSFGEISIMPSYDGRTHLLNTIKISFQVKKKIDALRFYIDCIIISPNTKNNSWQRISLKYFPFISEDEYVSLKILERDADNKEDMVVSLHPDRDQYRKIIPKNSLFKCIVYASFRAGARAQIIRKRFILNDPKIHVNRWPEYISDIKLKFDSDLKA